MEMPGDIAKLLLKVESSGKREFHALAGFDACIDIIAKIVREKKREKITEFFNSSSELARFLSDLKDKSCGLELKIRMSKPGGNMVITSNALGYLGVKVDCIGTFGFPDIIPAFRTISENCALYSVGDTIQAIAIEFDSSKVIMFDPGPYDDLTWGAIKSIIGLPLLKKMFSGKNMISFLNWSEILNSTAVWRGVAEEVLPFTDIDPGSFFFTDFSDCSRRSKEEIIEAVDTLKILRKYYKVILSMNVNESELISAAVGVENRNDGTFLEMMQVRCNTDIIVVHRNHDAIAYDGASFEKWPTYFSDEPKVLTGGGDNFNAGFCYSLLNGFELRESLIIANAVSGFYVSQGFSPLFNELVNFLKTGG